MKKSQPDNTSTDSAKGRRGGLVVVCSQGTRHRFLRGMITHDLVLRGLGFDDAYAVARAIRDQLSDRDEVTTVEIRDRVQAQLEHQFGGTLPNLIRPLGLRRQPLRTIIKHGQSVPFSRGVLARSIFAAGLDLDRAYRLVGELEAELWRDGDDPVASDEIARRVGDLLERFESVDAARRYRLVRRVHALPRPLVIYVGGASATGKSTLALELGPLLRIYRLNATDTIRQVMRMVFSPAILPGLHTSSFEVPTGLRVEEPGLQEGDATERLLASFEEQATRVNVGVRAVVERAIAENMSILVEGVHLFPPQVPFADLEGAAYQVPLILTVPDEEDHRGRFLARARLGGRKAERYVENFGAIRAIQDYLLQQAEVHDVSLLDTSDSESSVEGTLRLVLGLLQQRLPSLNTAGRQGDQPTVPTLLVVIDGLADRPVRALGGRTPLAAAATPTLDRLADEGQCGLADPVSPGVVPDTAAGSLALFGQSPLALKRGPVEALGAGLTLSPGEVALRGNFASLDARGQVVDRRAGRIREASTKLARALDRLTLPGSLAEEVEVRVKPATEHRLAIVLRGEGLSSAIVGSDPGEGAVPGPALVPQALDPGDEAAVHTARVLALFEEEARRVLTTHPVNRARQREGLPLANTVLTRGAGRIHRLLPLEEAGIPLRMTCISGDRTVLGLAAWLGARTVTSSAMTANLDTDLGAKFKAVDKALGRSDLVVLHLKGADIAAHDQRPELKATYIEAVDHHLGKMLADHKGALRIAVASDHATLSESGQHAADPLPVLIWGQGIEADEVKSYSEADVAPGRLQRFPLQMLLGRLFTLS